MDKDEIYERIGLLSTRILDIMKESDLGPEISMQFFLGIAVGIASGLGCSQKQMMAFTKQAWNDANSETKTM